MAPKDFIDRIAGAVRGYFALAGRGARTRTARRMGVSPSYFRAMLPTGLPLRRLGALLEALDVEPALFFARAFGTVDPLESFRAEARLIRENQRRERATLAQLRARYAVGALTTRVAVDLLEEQTRAHLETLDALRYEDLTRTSIRAARAARDAGDARTAARALGVWGSCLRMRYELDDATLALDLAFDLAADQLSIAGDLIQRAVYIVADRGEHDRGIELAERALVLYAELGDLDRIGQALVDRGVMLNALGRYDKAIIAFGSALPLLRVDSPRRARYRLTAFQGQGVAYYELRDLDNADRASRNAIDLEPTSVGLVGRLTWLRAAIAADRDDLRRAEALYRRTLEALADSPADILLVTAQLTRVLLRQKRARDGCELAKSLVSLVEPLEGERVLLACLADLVRAAMEGAEALRLELIDAAIRKIERARKSAPARFP